MKCFLLLVEDIEEEGERCDGKNRDSHADLAQERRLGKFLVVLVEEVLDPARFANHHNGTDCRKFSGLAASNIF